MHVFDLEIKSDFSPSLEEFLSSVKECRDFSRLRQMEFITSFRKLHKEASNPALFSYAVGVFVQDETTFQKVVRRALAQDVIFISKNDYAKIHPWAAAEVQKIYNISEELRSENMSDKAIGSRIRNLNSILSNRFDVKNKKIKSIGLMIKKEKAHANVEGCDFQKSISFYMKDMNDIVLSEMQLSSGNFSEASVSRELLKSWSQSVYILVARKPVAFFDSTQQFALSLAEDALDTHAVVRIVSRTIACCLDAIPDHSMRLSCSFRAILKAPHVGMLARILPSFDRAVQECSLSEVKAFWEDQEKLVSADARLGSHSYRMGKMKSIVQSKLNLG